MIVARWDQLGAGRSYPALDPSDTLTLDQMVSDTIELTNYLRERFADMMTRVIDETGRSK
ncbi:MAG: hypothetical protein WBM90_13815 [Acidimicrobiia bacterium]